MHTSYITLVPLLWRTLINSYIHNLNQALVNTGRPSRAPVKAALVVIQGKSSVTSASVGGNTSRSSFCLLL